MIRMGFSIPPTTYRIPLHPFPRFLRGSTLSLPLKAWRCSPDYAGPPARLLSVFARSFYCAMLNSWFRKNSAPRPGAIQSRYQHFEYTYHLPTHIVFLNL